MRLFAGDRLGAGAVAAALFFAACTSEPSSPDSATAAQTPTTPLEVASTEAPPVQVTIEALTPTQTAVPPTATPEPSRCPDPFPADNPLHGTRTLRLPHAEAAAVPPLSPIVVPPVRREEQLERAIIDRLGPDRDRYAVVVKDLRDGRGVALNDARLFYAASLFKLEVMYELFHQYGAGLIDFGERYIASDYYARFGLGPHHIEWCDEVTMYDAVGAMMAVSDNTAAVMLQDRAGPANINNAMHELGLTATALLPDSTLPTTARDMALLVETIARRDAINADSSAQMTLLMESEQIDDRIPSGVPAGTIVAHKTGNWNNATHDVGIVYGAKSTYVVVLMSDIGFDGDAGSVERDITSIVWQYFEGAAEGR